MIIIIITCVQHQRIKYINDSNKVTFVPLFGSQVWNDSGSANLTKWRTTFSLYWLCFTYTLIPHNMIILYFRKPCFHASNNFLFLHSTKVFSFYIDVVLTLSNHLFRWALNREVVSFKWRRTDEIEMFYQSLQRRHNGRDSVSNHQPHDYLLNRLFRRRSKKTSKLRVTGLCARNSPGTGEFPAQMASYAENVSIWWRHHGNHCLVIMYICTVFLWNKQVWFRVDMGKA